jgi:hypothetical protein
MAAQGSKASRKTDATVQRTKEQNVTKMTRFGAAALVVVTAAIVGAQEKPAPAAAPVQVQSTKQVPLKIQLVLSRYQADKKLSSVPYLLWVTSSAEGNKGDRTSLRMGVKIPVATSAVDGGVAVPSYSYQDVGTNIDCGAIAIGDGSYKVSIVLTDSSLYFQDRDKETAAAPRMPPSFRSFTSNFTILLHDGQTAQYTSATDQVSGEVLKIDATLNVLK